MKLNGVGQEHGANVTGVGARHRDDRGGRELVENPGGLVPMVGGVRSRRHSPRMWDSVGVEKPLRRHIFGYS